MQCRSALFESRNSSSRSLLNKRSLSCFQQLNYAKLNDLNAVANEQGDFNLSDLVDDSA